MIPAPASIQDAVSTAEAGETLLLTPGIYQGPIRIDRAVTLWGPREAIVRSSGQGHTIDVDADSAVLLGFSIEGSGDRFDHTDSAVHIHGDDCRVTGLHIEKALFGVTVERSHRARISGNEIVGNGESDLGLRGDAIRFWEVRDSEIEGNLVTGSRDMVVWYSPGNEVANNYFEFGRYGTHFMYSPRNSIRGNTYIGNLVGVFVMYSDTVRVVGNRMAFSDPTGGIGLGVKESGEVEVTRNLFLQDPSGLYIDTSPLQRGQWNAFEGNQFLFCDAGVVFHRSETNNRFHANAFIDSVTPVRVEGGGNAEEVEWLGNYFDDYQGYDLDHDGVGDIPYELQRLSDGLMSRRENLQFFRGTPALSLLDLAGRVFPLITPQTILRDPKPRLSPPAVEVTDAR